MGSVEVGSDCEKRREGDISIIIVSWNARKYLFNCLQSIVFVDGSSRFEVIVVDNASSDASAEMVLEQFPNVHLIRNERNLGFARANNIGMRKSHGRYICLINSDVVVLQGCIEGLVDFMDGNREIGIAGPQIIDAEGRVQRSCMGFPTIGNTIYRSLTLDRIFPRSRILGGKLMTFWSHDTTRLVDVINGCFWIVRREALDDVGLLDEDFFMYGEDIDWCKRFKKAGWQVMFFPRVKAIHYGGGSSSNAPINFFLERQHADLQYWQKHYTGLECLVYMLIMWFDQGIRIVGHSVLFLLKTSRKDERLFKIRRYTAGLHWFTSVIVKSALDWVHRGTK
jgi:GT2 family glycosyltransferase